MSERSPYGQGWLDGYEQFAKEQLARDARDSGIVQATANLQALLDQSARVRALETALSKTRGLLERWVSPAAPSDHFKTMLEEQSRAWLDVCPATPLGTVTDIAAARAKKEPR